MTSNQFQQTLETVFKFLCAYIDEYGYSPSLREISKACYMSVSTTFHYLGKLEAQGRIRRDPNRARSIQIVYRETDKA